MDKQKITRSMRLWACFHVFLNVLAVFGLTLGPVSSQAGDQEILTGEFLLGPDSLVREGAPQGRLEGPFEFHSDIFKGTVRRYWIFVPAQYDPSVPASLFVFQDGQRATNPIGSLQVQNVLTNLIHEGAIPPTIGLFITPGNLSEHYPDDLGSSNSDHRAPEYDALNDSYARFLIEDLLPHIDASYNLTDDPGQRVIGGTSSGAICAFTVISTVARCCRMRCVGYGAINPEI